jgi:endonuclease G
MAIQKRATTSRNKKEPKRVLLWFSLGFLALFILWFANHKTKTISKAVTKAKDSSVQLVRKGTYNAHVDNSLADSESGKEDWPEYAKKEDFGWGSIPEGSQLVNHSAYSLCYNEEAEQAWWVSYTATKAQVQDVAARRNNFHVDELVKTGSADPKDYSHSGYDRGHLAPCDDFKSSQEICDETFAMSNMTPQLHVFNAGRWKTLEEYVNRKAHYGKTILVTCGPIFNKSKESILKIGRNEVWVPKSCYKILFTGDSGTPRMLAFVMDNSALPKEQLYYWSTTVDEVEKLTGLDFFASMPDELEDKLEANKDLSYWFGGVK